MIDGYDITVLATSEEDDAEKIIEGIISIIGATWRNSCIENAENGEEFLKFNEVFRAIPEDVFIYKDKEAKKSWHEEGAVPMNKNSMIEMIRNGGTITLVMDDPEKDEMPYILEAIKGHIRQGIRRFWAAPEIY